jgi:heterotetrameric sarcosine oxidase gamma subunit
MAETRFRISVEPCTVVQVECWPGTLPALDAEISRQLGGKLPDAFGEAVPVGGWSAIRIAPRRFWLVADEKSEFSCSIDPELGSLVSLSEGRMRLRLRGPHTFTILEACVAIDWHEAKPGSAVQTGFHHVPVLLLCTATDACDLLVPRSFAESSAEWVSEVAVPYEARHAASVTA